MRAINLNNIPDNSIVLMTIEEIFSDAPMQVADFQDSFAISFIPTGDFIGFSSMGSLCLGKNPKMKDGVWFLEKVINQQYENVILSEEKVTLKRIK